MNKAYDLFASPIHSKQLYELGVTERTIAQYRVFHNGESILLCKEFDPFQLYSELPDIKQNYKEAYHEFPAYSLMELMKAIPGFTLTCEDKIYTVCGDVIFNIPGAEDIRAADAAAKCLIRLLRSRLMNVSIANEFIEQSKS